MCEPTPTSTVYSASTSKVITTYVTSSPIVVPGSTSVSTITVSSCADSSPIDALVQDEVVHTTVTTSSSSPLFLQDDEKLIQTSSATSLKNAASTPKPTPTPKPTLSDLGITGLNADEIKNNDNLKAGFGQDDEHLAVISSRSATSSAASISLAASSFSSSSTVTSTSTNSGSSGIAHHDNEKEVIHQPIGGSSGSFGTAEVSSTIHSGKSASTSASSSQTSSTDQVTRQTESAGSQSSSTLQTKSASGQTLPLSLDHLGFKAGEEDVKNIKTESPSTSKSHTTSVSSGTPVSEATSHSASHLASGSKPSISPTPTALSSRTPSPMPSSSGGRLGTLHREADVNDLGKTSASDLQSVRLSNVLEFTSRTIMSSTSSSGSVAGLSSINPISTTSMPLLMSSRLATPSGRIPTYIREADVKNATLESASNSTSAQSSDTSKPISLMATSQSLLATDTSSTFASGTASRSRSITNSASSSAPISFSGSPPPPSSIQIGDHLREADVSDGAKTSTASTSNLVVGESSLTPSTASSSTLLRPAPSSSSSSLPISSSTTSSPSNSSSAQISTSAVNHTSSPSSTQSVTQSSDTNEKLSTIPGSQSPSIASQPTSTSISSIPTAAINSTTNSPSLGLSSPSARSSTPSNLRRGLVERGNCASWTTTLSFSTVTLSDSTSWSTFTATTTSDVVEQVPISTLFAPCPDPTIAGIKENQADVVVPTSSPPTINDNLDPVTTSATPTTSSEMPILTQANNQIGTQPTDQVGTQANDEVDTQANDQAATQADTQTATPAGTKANVDDVVTSSTSLSSVGESDRPETTTLNQAPSPSQGGSSSTAAPTDFLNFPSTSAAATFGTDPINSGVAPTEAPLPSAQDTIIQPTLSASSSGIGSANAQDKSSTSSKAKSTGAAVGGVLGFLIAAVALFMMLRWYFRRKRGERTRHLRSSWFYGGDVGMTSDHSGANSGAISEKDQDGMPQSRFSAPSLRGSRMSRIVPAFLALPMSHFRQSAGWRPSMMTSAHGAPESGLRRSISAPKNPQTNSLWAQKYMTQDTDVIPPLPPGPYATSGSSGSPPRLGLPDLPPHMDMLGFDSSPPQRSGDLTGTIEAERQTGHPYSSSHPANGSIPPPKAPQSHQSVGASTVHSLYSQSDYEESMPSAFVGRAITAPGWSPVELANTEIHFPSGLRHQLATSDLTVPGASRAPTMQHDSSLFEFESYEGSSEMGGRANSAARSRMSGIATATAAAGDAHVPPASIDSSEVGSREDKVPQLLKSRVKNVRWGDEQ